MNIIIRKAIQNDAKSFAQYAEHTFRETYSADNLATNIDIYCQQNFGYKIQEQEINNPSIITFLAEKECELLGFAQLRIESSVKSIEAHKPSELYRLYVSNEQHGSGLARKIIKEVLRAASNTNSDRIWLGVWENNPRAITFYQKCGFSVVGEHVFKLGLDPQRDLIMVAEVESALVA